MRFWGRVPDNVSYVHCQVLAAALQKIGLPQELMRFWGRVPDDGCYVQSQELATVLQKIGV